MSPALGVSLPAGIRSTVFGDVTILTVSSDTTVQQVLETFGAFARLRPTPRVLWDLRARSLTTVPPEALRKIVSQLMLASSRDRMGGRSAFAVTQDADYEIMRALISFAENEGYWVKLRVFRDDVAALEWLVGRARLSSQPE